MYIREFVESRHKNRYLVIRESFINDKKVPASRNVKNFGYIDDANREEK
jgi:hypothetical protein